MDKQDDEMMQCIKKCDMKWTIVLPVEFMKNIVYECQHTILADFSGTKSLYCFSRYPFC